MKDKIKTMPWYFLSVLIPYIISPIIDNMVSTYFGEEEIEMLLSKTITITIKTIFPSLVGILILIICVGIYIYRLHTKLKKQLSADEIEQLQKNLTEYIDKNEYIESIQAYQFWKKNDSKSKYIKVCYLTGVADERIDINSIMQSYYYIPHSIYNRIKKISSLYDNSKRAKDPNESLQYKNDFKSAGTELSQIMLESLNQITTVDDIGEYHCEIYRSLLRIFSAVSEQSIVRVLKDSDIEEALIKKKKTGILGSIILNDLYIFRNKSSMSKLDRIYFTFPYDVKRGIVFLASMSPSCFTTNGDKDIESYCQQVISDICEKDF